MLFRKLLAAFLVCLFVVVAIPNFFIYALSRTYLNTDFYKRSDLATGVYDFVLEKTTDSMQDESKMLKGYFTKEELKKQISAVFTENVFRDVLNNFADQLAIYKQNPEKPLILSLKLLRQDLLTVSNNLAYIIYQDLPSCSEGEMALDKVTAVPICAPKDVGYDKVVRPVLSDFENTVYNAIPEELGNIDKAVPLHFMVEIENYRNISFVILLILISMITLVLWNPISLIVGYVGSAFFLGGAAGLGISYMLDNLLNYVNLQVTDPKVLDLIHFLLKFVSAEMSQLAWFFFLLGLALAAIRFVLVRTIDSKRQIELSN